MSTAAIVGLLLLGSASAYCGFRQDIGTGLTGQVGLALAGPCLALALWCLWWHA